MAKPIRTVDELNNRLNKVLDKYKVRNQMAHLCEELYNMRVERKSGFMSDKATAWRERVAPEYWESSNKAHNVVDVMTAVLSGHRPNWKCSIPGDVESTVPSRAEMFLDGTFRLNSIRQQKNLLHSLVFRMVKHGAVGIRGTWMENPPPVTPSVLPHPDKPQDEKQSIVVQMHDHDTFPVVLDVIDIRNLYPGARGAYGRPFSEIFYHQERTVDDVLAEWDGRGDTKRIEELYPPDVRTTTKLKYTEWWCVDNMGVVWYAICYDEHFIIKPTETNYPTIPFVIAFYKEGDGLDPNFEHLPFLYPIFHAIDKMEYLRSRTYRLVDMYANMNPYHSGDRAIQGVDATWGKILELDPKEDIKFPHWPGQPPDVYREMETLEDSMSEGTFSAAMFGRLSSRVSGYALSQVIGADTLRTDTPRQNLEMALTCIASLIFKLMQTNNPVVYMGITSQINNKKMTAVLSGEETKQLVIEAYVKPKQTSDEIRLATLGAQIAAQPNPPVSLRYILENFFGVSQPEEEIARKLDEAAMQDPIIQLMAMHEVLEASGSPYAPIIMAHLQEAVSKVSQAQQGQQGAAGMGMGLPQALGGNTPLIPGSGNPSEEGGPTEETNVYGGPREEI